MEYEDPLRYTPLLSVAIPFVFHLSRNIFLYNPKAIFPNQIHAMISNEMWTP